MNADSKHADYFFINNPNYATGASWWISYSVQVAAAFFEGAFQ